VYLSPATLEVRVTIGSIWVHGPDLEKVMEWFSWFSSQPLKRTHKTRAKSIVRMWQNKQFCSQGPKRSKKPESSELQEETASGSGDIYRMELLSTYPSSK
jgi:hypothetical protein